jgi:cholest-4-en-3-one 26-monooxygenase
VVSRLADVVAISKDSELRSSEPSVLPDSDGAVSIACVDNSRHERLRNLVNRGFTPRIAGKLEPKVRAILEQLLDDIAGRGSCDLVESVSLPLPMYIIAEMMGIPPSHYEQFHEWSDLLIGATTASDDPDVMARSTAT